MKLWVERRSPVHAGSVSRISAELLARWGHVELLGAAGGGHVNEVHFARLDGEECVVRATKRTGEAELDWELDLLALLNASGLGAPEIFKTTDGRRHVDGVVVYRRLNGSHPSTSADWLAVARYLTQLHEIGTGRAQRPGFVAADELLASDKGSGIDLCQIPPEVVARCRTSWSRLESVPRTVVHGDPGESNILIERGEVALIDWDEARVDHPWFDLAALPDDACPLIGRDRWVARQAASAWEAALTWPSDRPYAEWRLAQVDDPGVS